MEVKCFTKQVKQPGTVGTLFSQKTAKKASKKAILQLIFVDFRGKKA
jgi:hypothetical protein